MQAKKQHEQGSISISVTVHYEGVICYSDGSPPSLPRPSHPPQWASDGGKPSPHLSMRADVSLITEKEMLHVEITCLILWRVLYFLFIFRIHS